MDICSCIRIYVCKFFLEGQCKGSLVASERQSLRKLQVPGKVPKGPCSHLVLTWGEPLWARNTYYIPTLNTTPYSILNYTIPYYLCIFSICNMHYIPTWTLWGVYRSTAKSPAKSVWAGMLLQHLSSCTACLSGLGSRVYRVQGLAFG